MQTFDGAYELADNEFSTATNSIGAGIDFEQWRTFRFSRATGSTPSAHWDDYKSVLEQAFARLFPGVGHRTAAALGLDRTKGSAQTDQSHLDNLDERKDAARTAAEVRWSKDECAGVVRGKLEYLANQDQGVAKAIAYSEKDEAWQIKTQEDLANAGVARCRDFKVSCEKVPEGLKYRDDMIARIRKDGAAFRARLKTDLEALHQGLAGDLERTLKLYGCSEADIRQALAIAGPLKTSPVQ